MMIHLFLVIMATLVLAIPVYSQITNPLLNNQIFLSNITSSGQQHYYFSPQGSTATAKRRDRTFNAFSDINVSHDDQQTSFIDSSFTSLKKRAPTIMYLTLTSCSQPTPPPNYQGELPSIDLYLSTVSSNTLPGPTNNQNNNTVDDTMPGRISWQSNSSLPELWIGVAAPTLTSGWTGQWSYELAISTSQWMHPFYQRNDTMTLEDTDNTHALLVSKDNSSSNDTLLITQGVPKELKYSFCAAKSYTVSSLSLNITETNRGNVPRQQFMISNLTQGQTYQVYTTHQTPGTPITAIVALPITLQTKSDPQCRMIYDLDFCSDVAYSVPTDPNQDIWNITRAYDQQAQDLFAPFATALSQFNCNNTQYSLVRNCDDCYRDYKRWLCAVTIPRCTATNDVVYNTRDVTNGSARNPWIDKTYQPNSWTELLPCVDVCYQVVQSCPPFLQFNCPQGDLAAQQYGYWTANDISHPTCNRLHMNTSLLVISGASINSFSPWLLLVCSVFVLGFL